jgi:hypothetical protein
MKDREGDDAIRKALETEGALLRNMLELGQPTPRPMGEAPRDGTKVLAWWPPIGREPGEWVSTWWQRGPSQVARWEAAMKFDHGMYGPTHFLPHPAAPEDKP